MKMKKFLVVLLACAMILGFAAVSYAADEQIKEFSDIADQSQAAKTAIMKLAVLNVVEGNEGIGGPFRPSENLTRAEFAKIVCYLTGNVKMEESLKNVASKFPDVPVGQWFTGWVNAAAASGYFIGDPSGTFRPNANITMNEVVTVAMRCVGYNDNVAQRRGANKMAWPANYVTKATAVEILDDVTFVGSSPATRADMAIICNAVLTLNMVEYIESDMAFSLALSQGTVDPDGFSEIYYHSNETARENEYERILHKAFGCTQPRLIFYVGSGDKLVDVEGQDTKVKVKQDINHATADEIAAWDYQDFTDGELYFHFYNGDQYEVASTYYINKDFTLFDLAGMQANVLINDDDEVLFVDVRTSYIYADEVYIDNNRVVADGKNYRFSDLIDKNHPVELTKIVPDDSDDNPAAPAKIYIAKDGLVYAVKMYDGFEGEFGIFDDISEENVLEYKGDDIEKLNVVKDDYAIIKGGKFIKAEDLEEFDLVYYLDKSDGAKIYLAFESIEGKVDRWDQTKGKLTMDGTAYSGVGNFAFSSDGGDSWDGPDIKTLDIDSSVYEGDATYAKSYLWTQLSYVAANTITIKIIGVVSSSDPGRTWVDNTVEDPLQFKSVTIINTEGKEVNYTFHKDFRNGYNYFKNGNTIHPGVPTPGKYWTGGLTATEAAEKWGNASDLTAKADVFAGFNEGDIVQLVLDKDDNVKKIVNYVKYQKGLKADVTVLSARERITINHDPEIARYKGSFALPSDAIVFKLADSDDVSVVSVASVLAAGNFKADKVVAFDVKSSGAINVLYYIGETSSVKVGVFTRQGYDGGIGEFYTINGVPTLADGDRNLVSPPILAYYTISSGEVVLKTDHTLATKAGEDYAGIAAFLADTNNSDYKVAYGGTKYNSGGGRSLQIGEDRYYFNSDSYFYNLPDNEAVSTYSDFTNKRAVIVYDDDFEIVVAVIVGTPVAIDEVTVNTIATVPVAGAVAGAGPTLVTAGAGFTYTGKWTEGVTVTGTDTKFNASGDAVYTLTLTPKAGYTFIGTELEDSDFDDEDGGGEGYIVSQSPGKLVVEICYSLD